MKVRAIFAITLTFPRFLSRLALTLTLTLTLASACAHRRSTTDIEKESMEMKPYQEPNYAPGLQITDRKTVLKALEKAADDRLTVKLPIVLQLRADLMRGWETAYIGTSTDTNPEERILIRPNDSALGVSLADHIYRHCPQGGWCKLWVTGIWREKGLLLEEKANPAVFPFGLRAVIGPQADQAEALIFIEQK